jgi:biopolymer transport protein ExbD
LVYRPFLGVIDAPLSKGVAMATIDVGSGHAGRRALDHQIPLIPFIDFLLCLVAFLLVTAVWSQMARLQGNAQVPGDPELGNTDRSRELHVETRGEKQFVLTWKEDGTVINSVQVERKRVGIGTADDYTYPDLAAQIGSQWNLNGQHRSATDQKLDRAVLHVENTAPFAEIAAIMDALHATRRPLVAGSTSTQIPAFNVAFAVN